MAGVLEEAVRIKDFADYLFTIGLAYHWLNILGVRPTSKNVDKKDRGKENKPLLFQEFIGILPLDTAIKDETIRVAVAAIKDWPSL